MAAVRSQDDRIAAERQRQLALARLKREQRLLAQEEKFSSAALLLQLAEKQAKAQEDR